MFSAPSWETRSVGSDLNLDQPPVEADMTFWKGSFNLSSPRFYIRPNRILVT